MSRLPSFLIALALATTTAAAHAEEPIRQPTTVADLQQYAEAYRGDPRRYHELTLQVARLQGKARTARIVFWTGMGIGSGLAIAGQALGDSSRCDSLSDESYEKADCLRSAATTEIVFASAGLATMLTGWLASLAIEPSRKDVQRAMAAASKPRFQLAAGADPRGGSFFASARMAF